MFVEPTALGMEDDTIKDKRIKASPYVKYMHPRHARLRKPGVFWLAFNESDPWIQVRFDQVVTVTEVQTQSGKTYWLEAWVATLKIKVGYNTKSLTFINTTNPDSFLVNILKSVLRC